MGLSFNVPGTASYPGSAGWNVTFRMQADLAIRRKLELWTRFIFDDLTSTGEYGIPQGIIKLSLMNSIGAPIRDYTLWGAYCVSLGDYALDTTDSGSVVTQAATIAYQYWTAQDAIR